MTDRPPSEPSNGEVGKSRDERVKPSGSSSERPKSRNGENAHGHPDRSSPSSTHRNSPSPPAAFRHPSEMPAIAKNANMSGNNRPPSTTSVHSNNSGGATRTTATSRRGGRTRSRSPPAMTNRNSIASHDGRGFPPMNHAESDSNPSSAAAAAAAAAKALSSNPGGPPWSERGSFRDDRHRGAGSPGDEPAKFPSYDNHFQSSRSWPAEDHERPRRSGSYGHSQSIHRLPGGSGAGSGDLYGRHGPAGSYGSNDHRYRDGGRSGSMHPSYDEHASDDRRYRDRNSGSSRGPYEPDMRKDGRSMSPSSDRYGQPYYRGGGPPDGRTSPKGGPPPRSGGGGMSRVIGTATPIHVPRAAEAPPSRHSRSGTPASVFRGRPGSDGPPSRREDRAPTEEDSPQKILLSLRTPSTSFEEKQPSSKTRKENPDLPPSPDEPPQIQHSHHQHPSDFFEPSRSPKPGSIEMAPSFNLFNQSFDSFGDTFNVVGGLEASLQSTSFGAGPTPSGEFGSGQPLQRNLSGGNYTQQLLGGSGSGGALTFGMSPVNSFGNGPSTTASRRGSNMMVLGGQDHRSASPTQVLGMYHSYSGGGSHGMLRPNNSMNPLEDSHLRLSASSFGAAPSLSHNYTRSFGAENSSIMSYNGRMAHSHEEGGQLFYIFLRKHRAAFKECTFLLPGLKAALLETPLSGKSGDLGEMDPMMKPSMSGMYPEPSPQDTGVARRRVASAVCAFGGSQTYENSSGSGQSIFREKEETPTVTPSSSTGTPPGSRFQSRAKVKYGEVLPTRYYENENRLSWEFEENPPVEAHGDDSDDNRKSDSSVKQEHSSNEASKADGSEKDDKKLKADDSMPPTPSTPSKNGGGDNDDSSKAADSTTSPGEQPKMRYRCKLCGQPKQNHTCPFMQSLARSIGIMVYPAVNAFAAAEPGIVAPPLSEMNNFVGPDDGSVADTVSKASIPTPDRRHLTGPGQNGSTQVTPESRRSKARQITSPTSTLSTGSSTPQRPRTPGSAGRNRPVSSPPAARTPGSAGSSSRRSRKRRHGQMHGSPSDSDQGDLLFVEAMELKQEQFRMITPSKAATSHDAYTYPALPLPYAQRKRLSDNLFSLSQKVPQLTKECSAVLREAREKDMWDLAVAELMTQVVVVIHCHEGDSRFDGLRQYLLTLGIAC
ncbi:expressed unknown protein [Seminavis robusta]|uniref:Uncharacterized protein n=1 Tax=Seminavis robusta TaxID=568900 RepID=A0A9N8H4W6_9STRA|nr:expressed unknown protein [Seminavis robusta]|eukprot:Sro125_g060210.1 n/a (1160) ;mRNA; r:49926-53568